MNVLLKIGETVGGMSLMAVPVLLALFWFRWLMRNGSMKNVPRKFSYLLWSIAGFRLLCPVAIQSPLSLFNLPVFRHSVTTYQPAAAADAPPAAAPAVTEVVHTAVPARDTLVVERAAQQSIHLTTGQIAALVWVMGAAAVLGWALWSLLRLKQRTSAAVREQGNIYRTEGFVSPFTLGLIHPRIYLPGGLSPQERRYVLAHEQYHIRRRDGWVKLAGTVICALHWFNPLVWIACRMMNRDMELSCDEAVLSGLDDDQREDYSRTLLALAANRKDYGPALAFGTPAVRERITHALSFKRAGRKTIALALVVLMAAGLTCCTNAKPGQGTIRGEETARLDGGDGMTLAYSYSLPEGAKGITLSVSEVENNVVSHEETLLSGTVDELGAEGKFTVISTLDGDQMNYRIIWNDEKTTKYAYTIRQTQSGTAAGGSTLVGDGVLKLNEVFDLFGTHFVSENSGVRVSFTPWDVSPETVLAQKLFDARAEYVGSASEVGRLAGLLTENYTQQLYTDQEPYGVELQFTQAHNTTQQKAQDARTAICMLALVNNLGFYTQSDPEGAFPRITVEQAEQFLNVSDLKHYSISVETVQELLALLDSRSDLETLWDGDNTITRELLLYLPDEEVQYLAAFTETVEDTPQGILNGLIAHGAEPEGTTVNAFQRDGASLTLDLSTAFGDAVTHTGTTGEAMLLGSLTKTFLSAYNAEELTLTCDGAVIETGHAVYDEPLTWFTFESTTPPEQASADTAAPAEIPEISAENAAQDGENTESEETQEILPEESASETAETAADAISVADLDGTWQDQWSQRAIMEISQGENQGCNVSIRWGSSVSESDQWDFSGAYDPETGKIDFAQGVWSRRTTDENGKETEEILDGNLSGNLEVEGDTIRWSWNSRTEDAVQIGIPDMVFRKIQ